MNMEENNLLKRELITIIIKETILKVWMTIP